MTCASLKQSVAALMASGLLFAPMTSWGAGKRTAGFTPAQTQAYAAQAQSCAAQTMGPAAPMPSATAVAGQSVHPTLTFTSTPDNAQSLTVRINAAKGRIAAALTAKTPTLTALVLNDDLLDPAIDFGIATLQGRSPTPGITQTQEAEAFSKRTEESFLAFRACMRSLPSSPAPTTTAALLRQ